MNKNLFLAVAPAVALGATMVLLAPAKESMGFSKLGTSLNFSTERDWRVFNNFADSASNDNGIGSTNFPGWLGAELALWKAAAEWNSGHGDGTGDPTQPAIGDGGANFDFFFAGRATGPGNFRKVVSAIPNCGGGTFAYVTNGGNFWNMRFCDNWTWSDGPGAPIGQIDLQGVGCHEFGHALGLGHTGVAGSTMVGSTSDGFDQRAIEFDDIAGVQCIYNAKDPAKVEITGVNIDLGAGTITITGLNFEPTNNQVWFTNINATAPNIAEPKLIVSGLTSTGGGTQIVTTIPVDAADGEIHVKTGLSGGRSLSNSWPVNVNNPPGGGPLDITSITPAPIDALIPGTDETITITGTGFTNGSVVSLDLIPLPASAYTIVNGSTITVDMPQVATLGSHTFSVQEGGQVDFQIVTVQAPSGLVLEVGNGDPLNVVSGSMDVSVSGTPGDLHFVLYSGSNAPSIFLPFVELEIGNALSDLFELDRYVVNATSAVTTTPFPLPAITTTLYLQSISFSFGLPVPDSNVQSIMITP